MNTVPARLRPRDRAPRLVSLVVPVFNEEESIGIFLAAIEAALPRAAHALEIVFVDDGSRDATLSVLDAARADDPRIVVVELSRNFGKEAAMSAGLDLSRGEVVIPIDVDLQDPPDVIPAMIDRWRAGYDVVLGVRAERGEGRLKTATAAGFYRAFNLVSPMKLPPDAGDFRLMDTAVVDALRRLPERSRFMKGLFAWAGFPTATVAYVRPGRAAGTTSGTTASCGTSRSTGWSIFRPRRSRHGAISAPVWQCSPCSMPRRSSSSISASAPTCRAMPR